VTTNSNNAGKTRVRQAGRVGVGVFLSAVGPSPGRQRMIGPDHRPNMSGRHHDVVVSAVVSFKTIKHMIIRRSSVAFRWSALTCLALGSLFAVSAARAFTYTDEDLLLVFRQDGHDDVEYNLGNAGSLLNLPPGTTVAVTNWEASLLAPNFGSDLTDGVKVLLISTSGASSTNTVAWLTTTNSAATFDVSPAAWHLLNSKISGVGNNADIWTMGSAAEEVVLPPAQPDSYTDLASNTGVQPALIPYLGGASAFPIEGYIPVSLQFAAVAQSTASVKPPAAVVGTFQIDAFANITFTAAGGSPPLTPVTITAVSTTGGAVSVTFTTVAGVNYRLRYSPQVGPGAVWTITGQSVSGSGRPATLTDTPGGGDRFYLVESYQ